MSRFNGRLHDIISQNHMNKKIILGIIVIVVLVTGFYSLKQTSKDMFTIGAVLPMTGAASLWGETVKNGMDLALEGKTGLQVMYEDSRSAAADGVTAYNLLKSKGVDVFFSELSLVAVPLSKLALENKTQLLVSLVAAEHSSIVNDYTTRYYTDPTNYATPAFTSQISPVLNAKKIAILTRNDDLGNSVIRLTHKSKGAFIEPLLSYVSHPLWIIFRILTPVFSGLGLGFHGEVHSISAGERYCEAFLHVLRCCADIIIENQRQKRVMFIVNRR